MIWVDGSFSLDGRAGIGMCGALGEARRSVLCASSSEAELAAIAWGMEGAYRAGLESVRFGSDLLSKGELSRFTKARHPPRQRLLVYVIHRMLLIRSGWALVKASSQEVRPAHRLARIAARNGAL